MDVNCHHNLYLLARIDTTDGVKVVCECGWVHPNPTIGLINILPKAKLKEGFIFKEDRVVGVIA
jgi:hypothetical protein